MVGTSEMPPVGKKERTATPKTGVKFVAVRCTISYQADMNARIKHQVLCFEIRNGQGYHSILL